MPGTATPPEFKWKSYGWSNRILLLSLAGIFFLTFYPFQFAYHATPPGTSPFLLGPGKNGGTYDNFLNILLFMPFGFGLAEKFREKGRSAAITLGAALLVGALLSYFIEFVQAYIPSRDSGWIDIITNSTGSLAGAFLFELFGSPIVILLARAEAGLRLLLKGRRALILIPLYFAVWFAVSIALQMQTRLSDWDPNASLYIGNDAAGWPATAWKGELFQLQIWDRALPSDQARNLTASHVADDPSLPPVASFDFSKSSFRDAGLPGLAWINADPQNKIAWLEDAGARDSKHIADGDPRGYAGSRSDNGPEIDPDNNPGSDPSHSHLKRAAPGSLVLDGDRWLASTAPASVLVRQLKATNQFSVRFACQPSQTDPVDRRIVSLSRKDGPIDLQVRAADDELLIWFRTPLTTRRTSLAWHIPGVFSAGQTRDVLFSYNGATASLYLDGAKVPMEHNLGPAAGLAQVIRPIKTRELAGYEKIYYAIIFFPAGILLAAAATGAKPFSLANFSWIFLAALCASALLEVALVLVSGRAFSLFHVGLALLATLAGILWLFADRETLVAAA